MPYGIDVEDGTAPTGYTFPAKGDSFVWVNNTANPVIIKYCGNWCSPDTCLVPAAANGKPGTCSAQILSNPNTLALAMYDSGWNADGMPRIQMPARPARDKDAA